MQTCKMTLTTSVDGVENTITREGEMEISLNETILRYREENAFVLLKLQGESAEIERQGDYSLRLTLQSGKLCEGEIGIGGNAGGIHTYTHKVQYSVSKDALLLSLHYDLIISGEKQVMKLRLISRLKGE